MKLKVKIIANTIGDKCWYAGRVGETFDCEPYSHMGFATGDYVTTDPTANKDALIAQEDGEVQGACPYCGAA